MRRQTIQRFFLLFLLLGGCGLTAAAQKEVRDLTRSGNRLYRRHDYSGAEIDYRKALELSKDDAVAQYDLAGVLSETDRGEEAGKIYQSLLPRLDLMSPDRAADVAHNAGNTAFRAQQLEQAIEFYKESLRRRPTDEETRYNLALAQKLLEQQKQQGGGGGEDDQKQQDRKDQQEQNQDQQQDQQKDQQQQQPPQNEQEREDKMTPETANRILKALENDEANTRKKLEQTLQQQGRSRKKNW